MFASLSSFLPVALQAPPAACPSNALTPPPPTPAVDPPRKKEKKEKHANEAFIIVRPPPSKSAHPLSLQVQLVPPQSRNDRPLQALDCAPDDLDTDLKRTQSNRSETSTFSGYTSAGSVSSFASTSTATSGRRMIIPLYNLNVHAVMPSTISDAGTDAKVAKFARRGLEIIGLAVFEPVEVRAATNGALVRSCSARPSLDSLREFGTAPALPPARRPISTDRPNTSHAPVNASGDHPLKPIIHFALAPPLPPPDLPPQRPTRKLFTKMFRKKDAPPPLPIAVPFPDDMATPQPSPFRNSARRSDEFPASQLNTYSRDPRPSTPLTTTTTSPTSVLGVHSTLYPPVSNPKGRPSKYIWIVRKWLKGTDPGVFNGMMGKLSANSRDASPMSNTPHIEVHFEWSRAQKKRNRRRRADKSVERDCHGPTPRSPPSNNPSRLASRTLSPDIHNHRNSVSSRTSSGSDSATSLASIAHRHAEESGEESDPEDSETPWTCLVAVQRLGQPHHHQEPVIRLKVATLVPTPHHPKVVGLLKMPFPLPDIELECLVVRRRLLTPQGISKTTMPEAGEFVLTAEEIKDTVSCTALWLVVREAFGGVGRERRKGKS